VQGEVKFVADVAKTVEASKLGGSFAITCLELNKAYELSNKVLSEEDKKD